MNWDESYFARRGQRTALSIADDTSSNPISRENRREKRMQRSKRPTSRRNQGSRRQEDLGMDIVNMTVPAGNRLATDNSAARRPVKRSGRPVKKVAGGVRAVKRKNPPAKKSDPKRRTKKAKIKTSADRALKAMLSIKTVDPDKERSKRLSKVLSPEELADADDVNVMAMRGSEPTADTEEEAPLRGVEGKGLIQKEPVTASKTSPTRSKLSKADMSEDQLKVYDAMLAGKNVLMLGEGGTGKTELIKYFKRLFKARRKTIKVTASTGKAALLIGGTTLHSFAGIGLGNGTSKDLIAKVKSNRWAVKAWKSTKVLVIDEISMISAELLYKLEKVARAVRGIQQPFGGLQILGSGDFLQLPPVKADFCFKHPVFHEIFEPENCFVLRHNFRQNKDPKFRQVLKAIRWGNVTNEVDALMSSRVGVLPPKGIRATVIYPLRRQVKALNQEKMDALKGAIRTFRHEFVALPTVSPRQADFLHKMLLSSAPCDDVLELKVGAQVMHTKNNKETGKVNGSMGTVISFDAMTGHPIVLFNDGSTHPVEPHAWTSPDKKASLVQYPLIIAWAITVHKAQGATLDAAIIDLGKSVFEYNQAYTAASRVRKLQDLYLIAWDRKIARPHAEAVDFYKERGVPEALAASAPPRAQSCNRFDAFCESNLVFTEYNGWEQESWHRYFPCTDTTFERFPLSVLQERLHNLNNFIEKSFQNKRNGKTRFYARLAEPGELEGVKWKYEEGVYKVHKVMNRGIDLDMLLQDCPGDEELFQALYKCGVEGYVK